MGVLEGNSPCSDNDWETVTKGGDAAIRQWIDGQMIGRSCVIVLIGSNTAGRKWINYEIQKAWSEGKGVVGIHIHNLQNAAQQQSVKGSNPFDILPLGSKNVSMSSVVKAYDPPFSTSTYVYSHIKANLSSWVEEAITIRNNN